MDTTHMGVLTDDQLYKVAEVLVLCINYVKMTSLAAVLHLPCSAINSKINNTHQQILWLLDQWRTDSHTGQGLPKLVQLLSQWRDLPSYIIAQLQSLVGNSQVLAASLAQHATTVNGASQKQSTKSPYIARCLDDDDIEPTSTNGKMFYRNVQYPPHAYSSSRNDGMFFSPNYKNGFHLCSGDYELDHKHIQRSSSQQQQQLNNHHTAMPSHTHSLPGPPHPTLPSQPHPSLPSHPSLMSAQPTFSAPSTNGHSTSNGQEMHYTSRGLYAEGLPQQRHGSRQYSGETHRVALPPSLQSSSSSLSSGQSTYLVNQPQNRILYNTPNYSHQASKHSTSSMSHSYRYSTNNYSPYMNAPHPHTSMAATAAPQYSTYIPPPQYSNSYSSGAQRSFYPSSTSYSSKPYLPDHQPTRYEGAPGHLSLHERPVITSTARAEPLTPMSESKADSPPRSLDFHSPKRSTVIDPSPKLPSNFHTCNFEEECTDPSQPYIDIFSHPMDGQVKLRGTIKFVCRAHVLGSCEKPSYLWYKEEEPLIGEVESELVIKEASEEDMGYYFCVVSDVDGRVHRKSRTASLSLANEVPSILDRCPPFILQEPEKLIQVSAGDQAVLNLYVRACPPPTFAWYRNTIELSYATESTLVIPRMSTHTAGQYTCTITNDLGSIITGPYTLQLVRKPSFPELATSEPLSPSPGSSSPSDQQPSSPPLFVLSPFISDQTLSEVSHQLCTHTSNVHQLALAFNIQPTDIAKIRLLYSTMEEQVTQMLALWATTTSSDIDALQTHLLSKGYSIRMSQNSHSSSIQSGSNHSGVVIISHPLSQSVCCGETARLNIETNPSLDIRLITFQWYKDGAPLAKECSQQLLIYLARESDSGIYYCKVTHPHWSIDSNRAKISILCEEQPVRSHPALVQRSSREDYYSPVVDLHNPSRRKESGDTSSLPSLDSMQAGIHNAYSETGLSARGQLGFVPLHVAEDFHNMKLSEVKDKPTIIEHPRSQEVEAGGPLQLSVKATGAGELTYLWNFNGLSLPSEKRPEFILHCFTDEDEGNYYCEVSNKYGKVRTELAVIKQAEDFDL